MEENLNITNPDAKEVTLNGATYTITKNGKVFGKYGQDISIRPNTDGYASFTAGKKGRRTRETVHRLVAKLFIDNPNNLPEVDHLDSNRMNPAADNLEWVTKEENLKRAYARGNHRGRGVGEKNNKSKLNRELVSQMRVEYWVYSVSIADISKKHEVPWSTVSNVVKGYTWKHIPMPVLSDENKKMLEMNPRFNPRTE